MSIPETPASDESPGRVSPAKSLETDLTTKLPAGRPSFESHLANQPAMRPPQGAGVQSPMEAASLTPATKGLKVIFYAINSPTPRIIVELPQKSWDSTPTQFRRLPMEALSDDFWPM
jgi:hypothetical protein